MADEFVLIIAPDQPGIEQYPTFTTITDSVRALVRSGPITYSQLYEVCTTHRFRCVHYYGHSAIDRAGSEQSALALSGDDIMDKSQFAALLHACGAECIFINACNSGTLVSYCVFNELVMYGVYTTVDIPVTRAWEVPARFYRYIGERMDANLDWSFRAAFEAAIAPNRNGHYGLLYNSSLDLSGIDLALEFGSIRQLLVEIRDVLGRNNGDMPSPSWGAMVLVVLAMVLSTVAVGLLFTAMF